MDDSSHDKACLPAGLVAPRIACLNRDFPPRLERVTQLAARRSWVQRAGACASSTPVWTSREGWLANLTQWASSQAFTADRSSARVSITAATLLAVATVMAEHADHATGRHVAVTRARIADRVGCSPDTVTVAWRLLRAAGWVIEAQRGHGSPSTPTAGRRPSVYHLISRRQPATIVHNPDLPPKAGICISSSVGKYSPSVHEHAERNLSNKKRPCRAAPRPLAIQRLAAQLVDRCHGLSGTHIGAICDAINAAGIDPELWSARAITDALNADMATHSWSWPDRIDRPGAFLFSRLRRLNWQPVGLPNNGGGCAATSPENNPGEVPRPVESLTPAQQDRIAAAKAQIREILTASRRAS